MAASGAFAEFYTSAVIVGSERIGGVDTWIVDMEMDVAAAIRYLGGLQGTGFEELMPVDMFDAMDSVAATAWIAKDSLYLVRIHMDMTDMMAEIDETITKVIFTITSTNFNNARPVVLPAGAADAVEMELPL